MKSINITDSIDLVWNHINNSIIDISYSVRTSIAIRIYFAIRNSIDYSVYSSVEIKVIQTNGYEGIQ